MSGGGGTSCDTSLFVEHADTDLSGFAPCDLDRQRFAGWLDPKRECVRNANYARDRQPGAII